MLFWRYSPFVVMLLMLVYIHVRIRHDLAQERLEAIERRWWCDWMDVWHEISLAACIDAGDHKAMLFKRMSDEAARRGERWIDVYADLAHWTRFCREWHFVGHQYAMETLLAQVRADVAGPRPNYMHPVVGVERVVQALHAAGFVSDEGARRAGGRLPS